MRGMVMNTRRILVLMALVALGAMAMSAVASADEITAINRTGTVAVSNIAGTGGLGTIGSSVISSSASPLSDFNGYVAPSKGALGTLSFTTGTLESGSISGGGVFSSTGSAFTITGIGRWLAGISGKPSNSKMTLFTGSFVGPIDWTLLSKSGPKDLYALTGDVQGVLWNGTVVNLKATEDISFLNSQQGGNGVGHITHGNTQLAVPEAGTLGLFGTGLVGLAGVFRRKLMGS